MSQMKTPRAKLDALLALLNSAAQDAIAEYERTGDVPLKESGHPRDSQHPTIALKNALRVLEGACDQLCTTLAPPTHILLSVSGVYIWLLTTFICCSAQIPTLRACLHPICHQSQSG
jgi:hypothetical protein